MRTIVICLACMLVSIVLAGCSTVTPYSLDVAKESSQFGMLNKPDAAHIIKNRTSVSGETADYRSFLVDDEGFSYTKTTEETKTEWENGKSKERKFTNTLTRNVPWSAITDIKPYMEEYKAPFHHIRYRVELNFNIVTVKYGSRMKEREDFVLNCKSYEDLVDVVAALKTLTDL